MPESPLAPRRKIPTRPPAYTRPPTLPYNTSSTISSSSNDRFHTTTTSFGPPPPKAPKPTLTSSQKFSGLEKNLENLVRTQKEKSDVIFAGQGEDAVARMFKAGRMLG